MHRHVSGSTPRLGSTSDFQPRRTSFGTSAAVPTSYNMSTLIPRRYRLPLAVLIVILLGTHLVVSTVRESYPATPPGDDGDESYRLDYIVRESEDDRLDFTPYDIAEPEKKPELQRLHESQQRRKYRAALLAENTNKFGIAQVSDSVADDTLCSARVFNPDDWTDRFRGAGRPCRLLVVSHVLQSHADAQQHLVQLAALARRLGRVLVLPNMRNGAMDMCLRGRFEDYYEFGTDTGAVVRDLDASTYITMPLKERTENAVDDEKEWHALAGAVDFVEFQLWAASRKTPPTAQLVAVEGTSIDADLLTSNYVLSVKRAANVFVDFDNLKTPNGSCLDTQVERLDFSQFAPLRFYPLHGSDWFNSSSSAVAYGHAVSSSLTANAIVGRRTSPSDAAAPSTRALDAPPDIIVVSWDVLHPMFDLEVSKLPPLAYAQRWTSLAGSLTAGMGSFIVAHWSIQQLPSHKLLACADAFLYSLRVLLMNGEPGADASAVFLATDYPLHLIGDAADADWGANATEAMQRIKTAFGMDGALDTVRLTTLHEEMNRSGEDMEDVEEAFEADPGLLTLMDKALAVRATVFITGGEHCGVDSAFTREVYDRRAGVMEGRHMPHDETHPHSVTIRNVVSYFDV